MSARDIKQSIYFRVYFQSFHFESRNNFLNVPAILCSCSILEFGAQVA